MNTNKLNRIKFIEGDKLFLTPTTLDDLEDYYIWENDLEIGFLDARQCRPKSREQLKEDIESYSKEKKHISFSIILKDSQETIGIIGLYNYNEFRRTSSWGLLFDKKYWRKGYGTEASKLLLKYAFKVLDLRKLGSGTHSQNIASQKLQESLGFIREGVRRQEIVSHSQYLDAIDYGMLKEEYLELYG